MYALAAQITTADAGDIVLLADHDVGLAVERTVDSDGGGSGVVGGG